MLWLLANPAHAAAYYYIDSGARAIGRGGAFVVGADDMSAQYYNPAALMNIERPMFNLQGWTALQNVRFDRADEDDLTFEPVENTGPLLPEPSGGFAIPLWKDPHMREWWGTTVAVGLYVPTATNLEYPTDGPQRYQLRESQILQGWAGPSVAQRITPWVTVGAGLQYTFLSVHQKLASSVCLTAPEDCPTDNPENPDSDLALEVTNSDLFQLSGNFGIVVTPIKQVQIGASVQPPISYSAPGSLSAEFSENFSLASQIEGTKFTDPDTTLKVTLPLILRAGVQVTPIPAVRVELDGTLTRWSSMDEFLITDLNMTVPHAEDAVLLTEDIVVSEDIHFRTGFQDAWSVRLGGDWRVNDWAQVRAGGHYETSALPPEMVGPNLPDANKVGFAAGATFTVAKRVALDVGFAEQLLGTQHITNSEAAQQALWTDASDPQNSAVVPGKVVGNGDLTSNVTYVSVGATVYLGGTD